MAVLHQVLILFLMAAVGFFMMKKKIWNDSTITALTSLIITIGTPCLNFAKLDRLERGSLTGSWVVTLLISAALVSLFLGLGFLVFRKTPRDERAVYAQMVALSNCGFVGYPIIEAVLGQEAMGYAVAYVTAFSIVSWSVALLMFSKDWKAGLRRMLNPTLIGIFLGLLLQITGLKLPDLLSDTIETLGNLSTPVCMLVAGAYLEKVTKDILRNKAFLLACGIRLAIAPLLAFALLKLLGIGGVIGAVIFICFSMPGSSNTLVQACAYSTAKAQKLSVANIAITTVLSVATIPLLMLLL